MTGVARRTYPTATSTAAWLGAVYAGAPASVRRRCAAGAIPVGCNAAPEAIPFHG
jgi:hypothetical protein